MENNHVFMLERTWVSLGLPSILMVGSSSQSGLQCEPVLPFPSQFTLNCIFLTAWLYQNAQKGWEHAKHEWPLAIRIHLKGEMEVGYLGQD
jgi:hypothetical protein